VSEANEGVFRHAHVYDAGSSGILCSRITLPSQDANPESGRASELNSPVTSVTLCGRRAGLANQ
jgi:hypothetical protein